MWRADDSPMGNGARVTDGVAKDGRTRVLVIDDDEDVRDVLQVLLESEGYAVLAAADGQEGLLLQRRSPAAVVVTDIFMPGKEGIETVVELLQEFPQTKVIVVSGAPPTARADYGQLAVSLGAVRYLPKPLQSQDLIEAVRQLTQHD
jgi:CheY-like chemotaxis protein